MKRKAEEALEAAAPEFVASGKDGGASGVNVSVNNNVNGSGERVSSKRRAISAEEAKKAFRKGLFDEDERHRLTGEYASSVPYVSTHASHCHCHCQLQFTWLMNENTSFVLLLCWC